MHQLDRIKRLEQGIARSDAKGGAVFAVPLLGKVDVDWTDIAAPQSQLLGPLRLTLPDATYSIVQVAGRMVNALSGGAIGVADFQGVLAFDDQDEDPPNTRFVVGLGNFTGLPNGYSFIQWIVGGDGSMQLQLNSVAPGVNFARMALAVGQPIPVPFVIPGP